MTNQVFVLACRRVGRETARVYCCMVAGCKHHLQPSDSATFHRVGAGSVGDGLLALFFARPSSLPSPPAPSLTPSPPSPFHLRHGLSCPRLLTHRPRPLRPRPRRLSARPVTSLATTASTAAVPALPPGACFTLPPPPLLTTLWATLTGALVLPPSGAFATVW